MRKTRDVTPGVSAQIAADRAKESERLARKLSVDETVPDPWGDKTRSPFTNPPRLCTVCVFGTRPCGFVENTGGPSSAAGLRLLALEAMMTEVLGVLARMDECPFFQRKSP